MFNAKAYSVLSQTALLAPATIQRRDPGAQDGLAEIGGRSH